MNRSDRNEQTHLDAADNGLEIMRAVAKLPYVVEHKGPLYPGWEVIAAFSAEPVAKAYARECFKGFSGDKTNDVYGYRARPMLSTLDRDITEFFHNPLIKLEKETA